MASDREANPELSWEVDLMILDYLVCKAIRNVIDERLAERTGQDTGEHCCDGHLQVVDEFLPLFKSKHAGSNIPDEMSLKLQVLTFANLFLRRYKRSQYLPSPQTLKYQREKNAARANTWLLRYSGEDSILNAHQSSQPDSSRSPSSLLENRKNMLMHMGIPYDAADVPDLGSAVSLLDSLPEFMSICYRVTSPDVKHVLMETAAVFMLHVALEQILIYGRRGPDAVNEAFAWAWTDDAGSDSNGATAVAWRTLRDSLKSKISKANKGSPTPVSELQKLLYRYPLFTFEGSVLELLDSFLDYLETPILTQLDAGKLDGLSELETESLKDRVGIPRIQMDDSV